MPPNYSARIFGQDNDGYVDVSWTPDGDTVAVATNGEGEGEEGAVVILGPAALHDLVSVLTLVEVGLGPEATVTVTNGPAYGPGAAA